MDTPTNAAMDYINPAICLLLLVALPLIVLFSFFNEDKYRLPPGPPGWPIVGNLLQIRLSSQLFQAYVGNMKKKYGPIFTLRVGPHLMIMVASHELAHEALVQGGAAFATRPPPRGPGKIVSSNGMSISAAAYGTTWRALRRNLVAEALSPAAIRSFKQGREWGMEVLMEEVSNEARSNGAVVVVHHLRYAAFCILLYMCFGVRLEEKAVREVEGVLRDLLLSGGGVALEDTFPLLGFFFQKAVTADDGDPTKAVGDACSAY
uniref:TSA: Wollemia nobilis Ref_Wollemi_Transcript_14115_1857 transcribed RNA sequence n=1 Tax=Wollemia nobilis TaxID=56998 RepID=A0A0C9S488_9CONI